MVDKYSTVMQSSEDTLKEIDARVTSDELKCARCPKVFLDQRRLREHERRKHVEKTKSCALCPMMFPHKYSLNTHMKITHLNVSFSCDICQSNFPSKQCLQMHQNTHKEENTIRDGGSTAP